MANPDLTNCDLEPIHIPGKIQEHGFLIAINTQLKIIYCSENISSFTGVSAFSMLETTVCFLETVILKMEAGFIEKLIHIAQTNEGFRPINPYPVLINDLEFNLIISDAAEHFLLEFERSASDLKIDLQQMIGNSLSEILNEATLSKLLFKSAAIIKNIIGYDRVLVYKFHEDGHGEVVAEAKRAELAPLMGLHYPASDIPQQARELYKRNLIRLIVDVASVSSAIFTNSKLSEIPLDLTNSVLRAVSPIHIQYLKNMGIASSFSVSLIHQGELWGLMACHNYTPRFINYKQREAAKIIGQVLSSSLSFRQQEEDHLKISRLKGAVDALAHHLLSFTNIEDALFKHDVTLMDVVEACGAVLAFENQFHHIGKTPDNTFLVDFIGWLQENMYESFYATDRLPVEYPPALAFKNTASGVLVCRLSKELKEYLIWFRPEVATTVTWAGNPEKPLVMGSNGLLQISPRESFDSWIQQVKLTSTPWKNEDFRCALMLKEEVAFAISRKSIEIRILNEKLKDAYEELDAFSYTISHDLKNPLTAIKSYSQLLKLRQELEAVDEKMVDGILNCVSKMQIMIEEVLHYSKVGHTKSKPRVVDMTVLLEDLKNQLLVANERKCFTINIGQTPNIFGDLIMVQQVFSNLLGNAIKYSSKTGYPMVTVSGELIENQVRYRISDNGIGIELHDREKIFDLFTRSKDVGDYEGSGVGLAIVKKIMEKHLGRIWVESEPKEGATFHIAFPAVLS